MTSVAAEAEATMVVKVVAAVGGDAGCLRFAGLLKNAAASSRGKLRGYSHPARGDERGESGGAGGGGENREWGSRPPWRLRCLDLAWLCTLHAVRIQTDLRGFARQKVRARRTPGFTLVMRAPVGKGETEG